MTRMVVQYTMLQATSHCNGEVVSCRLKQQFSLDCVCWFGGEQSVAWLGWEVQPDTADVIVGQSPP
jgi:hypothetical protein